MRQSRAEAERWLRQAENDFAFAELGAREGFFAQACFVCQQAAEKALKALHYLRGERLVLTILACFLDGPVSPRLGRPPGSVVLATLGLIALGTFATAAYRTAWIGSRLRQGGKRGP